jgi:hypothetical protein
MLEIVNAETKTYAHAAQIVDAEKTTAQTKIIKLIRVWSEPKERYADLHSQVRTSSAHEFVFSIYHDIADHERKTGKRVRKRHWRTGKKLVDTLERFVGDLLRVKAGTTVPALVYRAVGSSSFKHDPVKYDMFMRALEALKALDLVGHRKGQSRYAKTPFGNAQLPGHAARFWATAKLLRLAEDYGIHSGNVGEHFAPEPPPLVLKDYAGSDRLRMPISTTLRWRSAPTTLACGDGADGLLHQWMRWDLARHHALPYHRSLELREYTEHLEHRTTRRGGRIEPLLMQEQIDALCVQISQKAQQVR